MKLKELFVKKKIEAPAPLINMGESSMLLEEAKIENYTGNKDAISIGENTYIRGRLLIYPSGGNIKIGDWCYVGENTNVWSANSIIIGNHVLIAHNVNIFDHDTHPIDFMERREHFNHIITKGHPKVAPNWNEKPVIIKDDAWIACGAIILKGVTIGRGAIVAAGAVVTHDVEDFTIVAGNPAKVVRKLQ